MDGKNKLLLHRAMQTWQEAVKTEDRLERELERAKDITKKAADDLGSAQARYKGDPD